MNRLFAVALATQLRPENIFTPPATLTKQGKSWAKALSYVHAGLGSCTEVLTTVWWL